MGKKTAMVAMMLLLAFTSACSDAGNKENETAENNTKPGVVEEGPAIHSASTIRRLH